MAKVWTAASKYIDYLMTVRSSDCNVYLSLWKEWDGYTVAYHDMLMSKPYRLHYDDLESAMRDFYESAKVI